ncbi:MAG: C40 family peptidase [Bacteroidota bacterium]
MRFVRFVSIRSMKTTPVFLSLCCLLVLSSCGLFQPISSPSDGRTSRGSDRNSPTSYIRTDIITHAQELLGTRYKYGGNTPREGFDCSGFTRYLYQNAGLNLSRVSRDQADEGRKIRPEDARPVDLVFYKRPGGKVFHVSVIVQASANEIWVIHSTSSRGVIRENILASSYWKPKIYQVRDVLN